MPSFPEPLGGIPPDEIPLSRSPLTRVLAQARFSSVLKIDSREAMAGFQEEVRADYPLLDQIVTQQFQLAFSPSSQDAPVLRPMASNLWRFTDADRSWVLSLAADAVTLETQRYVGRGDFLDRLREALAAVERVFSPSLALRLGVRYVNRIKDEDSLESLTKWVRPSLIGVAQPELHGYVTQALSEANLSAAEGSLALRWGILAANSTFDPALLDAIPVQSWILDIDVFTVDQYQFSAEVLSTTFELLANRAYSVFRYAITSAGLQHFGAPS